MSSYSRFLSKYWFDIKISSSENSSDTSLPLGAPQSPRSGKNPPLLPIKIENPAPGPLLLLDKIFLLLNKMSQKSQESFFLTADNIQIPKKSCFNPVYSCSGLVTGRQWPLDRFNSAQTRILPHKWSHLSTHLQNFRKEQYLKKKNLW